MSIIVSLLLLLIELPAVALAKELPPILGTRYDIGGYKVHLYCQGHGAPTVIIDAGLGDDSWDWQDIVKSASNKTQTCVYDRPGYGWSDVGPRPRTSRRIAHELNLLLHKARLSPPYVLVGHSFGGYNMRLFASEHPDDVAGLVLVEASHEHQYDQLDIKLPPPDKGQRNIFVTIPLDKMNAGDPKDYSLRDRAFRSASYEIAALSQSSHQVEQSGAIPTVPLIVISRGQPEWYGNENATKREKIWINLQRDLTHLSPISQQIFANHSGHDVPKDQPEIIVDAIANVIDLAQLIKSP
ncbi:MAG: alpha/beta hydrolase [Gammaproteobacteria bacterium]|nr:alpha/beta hydrolase [Gammaproteobacteria bacterium]